MGRPPPSGVRPEAAIPPSWRDGSWGGETGRTGVHSRGWIRLGWRPHGRCSALGSRPAEDRRARRPVHGFSRRAIAPGGVRMRWGFHGRRGRVQTRWLRSRDQSRTPELRTAGARPGSTCLAAGPAAAGGPPGGGGKTARTATVHPGDPRYNTDGRIDERGRDTALCRKSRSLLPGSYSLLLGRKDGHFQRRP